MKSLLKVTSVEIKNGFLPPFHREYSASGSPVKTVAKCLHIKGEIDGLGLVSFFTPSVLIKTSFNMNSEFTNIDDNSWISFDEFIDHSNATDDLIPYVRFRKEMKPTISINDIINISYSVKSTYSNNTLLNRVRIIK